jgi:hypothetical protein
MQVAGERSGSSYTLNNRMSDLVLGAIIGAAAAALGGVIAGAFDLLARRQDRKHDSLERAEDRLAAALARREERESAWLERSAETLARVLEFATDVHPANSTALIQDTEHAKAKLERLEGKWEALRQPLGVLIIGLPSAVQRDLAADVLERFRRIYNGLAWILADLIRTNRNPKPRTILDLTANWNEAQGKLHELREALHNEPGPS